MTETLISPGVLTRENDSSQVTQGPQEVGAAILGPSAQGPVGIPTLVTSYSQYVSIFGDTVEYDGGVYSYLTSISVNNYFQNGGRSVLMTRIAPGNQTPGNAVVESSNPTGAVYSSQTYDISSNGVTFGTQGLRIDSPTVRYIFIPSSNPSNQNSGGGVFYYDNGNSDTEALNNLAASISSNINTEYTATVDGNNLTITSSRYNITSVVDYDTTKVTAGSASDLFDDSASTLSEGTLTGGVAPTSLPAFTLETLSVGEGMNTSSTNLDSLKIELTYVNEEDGTFNILVRKGSDTNTNKSIVESFERLSLDPYSINYIAKRIGDLKEVIREDNGEYYTDYEGTYPLASNYIRVKSVASKTPKYDKITHASLLPSISINSPSGEPIEFTGATGQIFDSTVDGGVPKFYKDITGTNNQGINPADYLPSISLLSNVNEYKFNLITAPGIIQESGITDDLVNLATNRADCLYVVDLVGHGSSQLDVINKAAGINSSYAAAYWPWIQTIDPNTGEYIFVPPSTLMSGVYAFTDRSSEPWFAPAGLTRGGLGQAVRAERRLKTSQRDSLYQANINPIATFPGQGVVVYGQKTLEKSEVSTNRINVRRLLIELKSYIGQVANTLVFDQNTLATRNNFLADINPYMESIQQRQGLYAFEVRMDNSNNTADVIDRNELVGAIYIQPTKTIEFIKLDFNITPTGTSFPS